MLKQLRISNIILIESQQIDFSSGLNIISGETGSGKSAIMNSINLISGDRADSSLLRSGAEKGIVEAFFDIDKLPEVEKVLNDSGIDHETGEELILRREILSSGKSRAFINNQAAQITLLKKLGSYLLDITGQHANQRLFSLDQHRVILDTFGEAEEACQAFGKSWDKENKIHEELDELIRGESQRLRDIEVCRMELEELEEANLKANEEEDLFSEYALLFNAEERACRVNEITHSLSNDRNAILAILNRQKINFDQLVKIDPALGELAKSYENALIELQEVAHSIRNYSTHIEHNPERANEVNQRLSLINRLKRKYGQNIEDINDYKKKIKLKLETLEKADTKIEELQKACKEIEEQNNKLALELTFLRKTMAQKLEKTVVQHLRNLNMPKVEFITEVTEQKRTCFGNDRIEFFLIPNVGEHKISVRECASGGELSRLMLAIQTVLSGKQQTPTLIFDEIDANIGGETATIVAEKLKEIGQKHQVLCVTHFPQVAKQADHHLQISKEEHKGRTLTVVTSLHDEARERELGRMLGLTAAM